MASPLQTFRDTIQGGLRVGALTSCSRWAEKCRVMSKPFPGAYSFYWHPWAREPHDSLASWNVCMKAAQTGFTEVGINRTFYALDVKNEDVLYAFPTEKGAIDFSRGRFTPALRLSSYIRNLFTDVNTVSMKQAGEQSLYIRGTRGEDTLIGIPVSELVLDEVDRMEQDKVWLALERLSGQPQKCVWAISTPTLPNKGIHLLFQTTTQEHFIFKCPKCSKWTELIWPDCIEYCGESISDPDCKKSFLKCKECKGKLDHEKKPQWLKLGKWAVTDKNADPDRRGFYMNQLYSSTVEPWEMVVAHMRGVGDEGAASEFHNSKLGLPYVAEGSQITDEKFDRCIGSHSIEDARPTNSQRLITMGIDQGKWNYIEVTEWFIEKFDHDLNTNSFARVLWAGRFHEDDVWPAGGLFDTLMQEWKVHHCVIDADPSPHSARQFARRFAGYVTLCRFRRGVTASELKVTKDPNKADLVTVDRTNWLDAALKRFALGRIELPVDIGYEYREHLKSPVRHYEKDEVGNYIGKYSNTGPDHYAFARCYSEIALPFAASYMRGYDIKNLV